MFEISCCCATALRGSVSRVSVWLRLRRPWLSLKFVNEDYSFMWSATTV